MKIALVQTDLFWEDIRANLSHLEEQIWTLQEPVDVIVLPEMFTTGFTMQASTFAEPMNFTTFKWMKQMAEQTNAAITGSYIVKENGLFFNRLVWMQPNGTFFTYNKRHLFTLASEPKTYHAGDQRLIVTWRGWRFCPLICYDLRFPVWSRNDGLQPYDCLLYVANWPQKRIHAWNTLLKARAIENVCYSLGVNRVGTDGTGLYYNGDTAAYDFTGNTVDLASDKEEIMIVELDKDALAAFRASFTALMDGDSFHLL